MTKLFGVMAFSVALIFASAKTLAQGATAPYNEAVKIVNGKRVVELPPIPGYVLKSTAWRKPGQGGVERTRIAVETESGLMDCDGIYGYDARACVPSNFGQVRTAREWVVKRNGKWQVCVGFSKPQACKNPWTFAFLPTVQE